MAQQGSCTCREFLRVPALSPGLFAVGSGHSDSPEPHQQDEVYVVAAGHATLIVAGARTAVAAGSIAYCPPDSRTSSST